MAFTLAIIGVLCLLAAPAPVRAGHLDDLSWLLGTWQRSTKSGHATERWQRLGEHAYVGEGRSIPDDSAARLLEHLMLVTIGDDVFYLAKPTRNAYPTPFRLTASGQSHAIFENPTYDFPKKLDYRRADDTLTVTVTGENDEGFTLHFTLAAQ